MRERFDANKNVVRFLMFELELLDFRNVCFYCYLFSIEYQDDSGCWVRRTNHKSGNTVGDIVLVELEKIAVCAGNRVMRLIGGSVWKGKIDVIAKNLSGIN